MGEQSAPGLVPLVQSVHERLLGLPARPSPHVAFYPYVSTKSTIRKRDGRLFFRLSHHLRDAPDGVLRGVVGILMCRLLNVAESKLDTGDVADYHRHIEADKVAARRAESKRSRGRKHIDPIGTHRSLLESFMRVVLDHDIRLPSAPTLSWTKTESRRRFGHHDSDHNAIVISQVLDDPDVPEFVLDYVVYHELLHIVMPPRMGSGGKRIIHPKEFTEAERRFPQWREAEEWLSELASGRKAKRIVVKAR